MCGNCNEEKPAAAFPHKRNSVDHLDYHCKACHIAATAERVARRGLVNEPAVTSKVGSQPFFMSWCQLQSWPPWVSLFVADQRLMGGSWLILCSVDRPH